MGGRVQGRSGRGPDVLPVGEERGGEEDEAGGRYREDVLSSCHAHVCFT